MNVKYNDLFNIDLPEKTHSYQPVPHYELADTVKIACEKRRLNIVNERYTVNGKGEQFFGSFDVQSAHLNFRRSIGFRNSYDKSLAVGMCAGTTVIVCSNLMFKGDIVQMRKHTTNVFNDLNEMVENCFDVVDVEFQEIVSDSEQLKNVSMNKTEMAEIAGRLFIEDELINSTQLNIIKREILGSPLFPNETAWDFYNHITESLKVAAPRQRMTKQIEAHRKVLELV